MKNYSASKMDQRIAFEIDDTILVIAKVLSQIENKLAMPIVGKNTTELKDIFSKVTKDVIVAE